MTQKYYRNINDFLRALDPFLNADTSEIVDEETDTIVGSNPQRKIHDKQNTGNITYFLKEDGGVTFSMSVAGCSKENVVVELEGNAVGVTASEDGNLHSYFFNVNTDRYNLNPQSVSVQCKNGLLVISFEKKTAPTKQSNRLTIQ